MTGRAQVLPLNIQWFLPSSLTAGAFYNQMPKLCHCDLKVFRSSEGIPALFFLTCKYWSTTCQFIICLTAWQEDPISQEGRQGMLFIVSNSLSGTALLFVFLTHWVEQWVPHKINEDTYISQHASGGLGPGFLLIFPFPTPTSLWSLYAWRARSRSTVFVVGATLPLTLCT